MGDIRKSPSDSNVNDRNYAKYNYACPFTDCNKLFNRPSRLETHIRVHTGDRPFKCDIPGCSKTYTRFAHLKRHKQVFDHRSPEPSDNAKNLINKSDSPHSDANKVEETGKKRRKNSIKCPEPGCGLVFNKYRKLTAHKAQHPNFVYPCICSHDGCSKGFLYMSKLRKHMKIHEGYPCSGCGDVFDTWTLYRRHYSSQHKNALTCGQCDRTFYRPAALAKHVLIHADRRDLIMCPRDGCDRGYADPGSLAHHVRSYHDGRRFACDVPGCAKKFVAKCSLQAHKRSHEKRDSGKTSPRKPRTNEHRKRSMVTRLTGIDAKTALPLLEVATEQDIDMGGVSGCTILMANEGSSGRVTSQDVAGTEDDEVFADCPSTIVTASQVFDHSWSAGDHDKVQSDSSPAVCGMESTDISVRRSSTLTRTSDEVDSSLNAADDCLEAREANRCVEAMKGCCIVAERVQMNYGPSDGRNMTDDEIVPYNKQTRDYNGSSCSTMRCADEISTNHDSAAIMTDFVTS